MTYINVVLQKRGTNGEEEEAGGGQEAGGFLVRRHLPQHEQAWAADQHAEAAVQGGIVCFDPDLSGITSSA